MFDEPGDAFGNPADTPQRPEKETPTPPQETIGHGTSHTLIEAAPAYAGAEPGGTLSVRHAPLSGPQNKAASISESCGLALDATRHFLLAATTEQKREFIPEMLQLISTGVTQFRVERIIKRAEEEFHELALHLDSEDAARQAISAAGAQAIEGRLKAAAGGIKHAKVQEDKKGS